jgi:DNA invertase Pin-like site-specific DNA recombinase
LFHILASIDEFQRELIVEGTHEGLAAARTRAYRRPEAETRHQPPDGLQGTLPRGGEVTGGIHWRRETSLVCH